MQNKNGAKKIEGTSKKTKKVMKGKGFVGLMHAEQKWGKKRGERKGFHGLGARRKKRANKQVKKKKRFVHLELLLLEGILFGLGRVRPRFRRVLLLLLCPLLHFLHRLLLSLLVLCRSNGIRQGLEGKLQDTYDTRNTSEKHEHSRPGSIGLGRQNQPHHNRQQDKKKKTRTRTKHGTVTSTSTRTGTPLACLQLNLSGAVLLGFLLLRRPQCHQQQHQHQYQGQQHQHQEQEPEKKAMNSRRTT